MSGVSLPTTTTSTDKSSSGLKDAEAKLKQAYAYLTAFFNDYLNPWLARAQDERGILDRTRALAVRVQLLNDRNSLSAPYNEMRRKADAAIKRASEFSECSMGCERLTLSLAFATRQADLLLHADIKFGENIEWAIARIPNDPPRTKAEKRSLIDCLENFYFQVAETVTYNHLLSRESLHDLLYPYFMSFQEKTKRLASYDGCDPLGRVFYHVYTIAKEKDPSVGGDRWGEWNACHDPNRLMEALAKTHAEAHMFEGIAG